jgi:hypothetical protein
MSPDERNGRPHQETAAAPTPSPTVPRGWDNPRRHDPVTVRRRHAYRLDDHLSPDGSTEPRTDQCPGWHEGPCDYWSACTGMNLGVIQRDAAGAVHPWRVAA